MPEATLITDKEGRRTFESDALTAYRCMPLAVVLAGSTEEVSKILRFCHENQVKVVPRVAPARRSPAARSRSKIDRALPTRRMTGGVEVDTVNRVRPRGGWRDQYRHHQRGFGDGFFYTPDPSSQITCTIGGNIATNSGGAHCLKYGVTTNNVLGVRMVLMSGEIVDIGGPG